MSVNHAAVTAFPITSSCNQTYARNLLVQRMPYVILSGETVTDLVAVDPTTGTVIQDILYLGRVFHYDSTDSTTTHDGTTCLVSSEGKRYKLAQGTDVFAYSVINVTTTTPPVSPSIGDAYLIATGGTGAWSTHDDEITVYQSRGWEFIDFGIGRFIYNEETDSYYHKKADGTWTLGFGTQSLGTGTVLPSSILGGGGRVLWIVENQTTNTPPAVSNGVAYIIGSSPTGAWVGHAGKIAHGESSAWVIYTPGEGWKSYDKSTDTDYLYTGSAWIASSGDVIMTPRFYTASATWSKPSRLIYIEVECVGGGGLGGSGVSPAASGSTSSFGSHCSATGGTGGSKLAAGPGGSGTGGDVNITGEPGQLRATTVTEDIPADGGVGAGSVQPKGRGGGASASSTSAGGGGGGGGAAIKKILAASLGSTEAVTVGSAAQNNGCVFVKEYTRA